MKILLDLRQELRQEVNDEKSSMISISVENELQKWIKSAGGIFKKLSDGKYFVMFEEKYLKEFISDKFKISLPDSGLYRIEASLGGNYKTTK